jgi:hypothetical protein
MFNWIRRRRLSADARRKLLLVAARSEEAIVETHVANILDLLDSLGEEVDLDHALELYAEMMSLDDSRASTVATRLLARLEARSTRPADDGRNHRFRNIFRDNAG